MIEPTGKREIASTILGKRCDQSAPRRVKIRIGGFAIASRAPEQYERLSAYRCGQLAPGFLTALALALLQRSTAPALRITARAAIAFIFRGL
jgi:hypothetical protein